MYSFSPWPATSRPVLSSPAPSRPSGKSPCFAWSPTLAARKADISLAISTGHIICYRQGWKIVLTTPSFGAKLRYRRPILNLSRSAMAHHPVPDHLKPDSPTTGESETLPCDVPAPAAEAKFDSNLTDLAARFVTQSGGCLSPEISAELALEIVLNEIVEQACLATRATGAAIVLRKEGEMVCRASSGETAPALGVRFDIASGLSGLCIETSQVQRCDDAQTDLRADVEACRRLVGRFVTVLPLLRDAEVVGLFEIFSSRPSAFGDRDEHTLEALSRRG